MDLPLGIDFGGSGIKGAPVDLEAGDFAAERSGSRRPQPSTPEAVAEVLVASSSAASRSRRARSGSPCRASSGTAW